MCTQIPNEPEQNSVFKHPSFAALIDESGLLQRRCLASSLHERRQGRFNDMFGCMQWYIWWFCAGLAGQTAHLSTSHLAQPYTSQTTLEGKRTSNEDPSVHV